MIKLFKKDGKASIISHLWNIHYKLSIFEVDYMVVLCLAQNLTLWKFRKKIWLLFWLIWEKFGGFLKKIWRHWWWVSNQIVSLYTLILQLSQYIFHCNCLYVYTFWLLREYWVLSVQTKSWGASTASTVQLGKT